MEANAQCSTWTQPKRPLAEDETLRGQGDDHTQSPGRLGARFNIQLQNSQNSLTTRIYRPRTHKTFWEGYVNKTTYNSFVIIQITEICAQTHHRETATSPRPRPTGHGDPAHRRPCPTGPPVPAGLWGGRWRSPVVRMLKDGDSIENHMPAQTLS